MPDFRAVYLISLADGVKRVADDFEAMSDVSAAQLVHKNLAGDTIEVLVGKTRTIFRADAVAYVDLIEMEHVERAAPRSPVIGRSVHRGG